MTKKLGSHHQFGKPQLMCTLFWISQCWTLPYRLVVNQWWASRLGFDLCLKKHFLSLSCKGLGFCLGLRETLKWVLHKQSTHVFPDPTMVEKLASYTLHSWLFANWSLFTIMQQLFFVLTFYCISLLRFYNSLEFHKKCDLLYFVLEFFFKNIQRKGPAALSFV